MTKRQIELLLSVIKYGKDEEAVNYARDLIILTITLASTRATTIQF